MRKFHLPPVEEALRVRSAKEFIFLLFFDMLSQLPPNKHPKNQVSDVDRYLAELSKRVLMRWRALVCKLFRLFFAHLLMSSIKDEQL